MKRSPSAGYGFEPNKNTDWLEDRYFFVYYALLLGGFGLLFRTSDTSDETHRAARRMSRAAAAAFARRVRLC